MHLYTHTECTPSWQSLRIMWTWVIMVCQCRFISCSKCISGDIIVEEILQVEEGWAYENLPYLSHPSAMNPKCSTDKIFKKVEWKLSSNVCNLKTEEHVLRQFKVMHFLIYNFCAVLLKSNRLRLRSTSFSYHTNKKVDEILCIELWMACVNFPYSLNTCLT